MWTVLPHKTKLYIVINSASKISFCSLASSLLDWFAWYVTKTQPMKGLSPCLLSILSSGLVFFAHNGSYNLKAKTSTWKNLFDKMFLCTRYSPRILSRQESFIKVHGLRLREGHQRRKGYTPLFHDPVHFYVNVVWYLDVEYLVTGTRVLFKLGTMNLFERWIMKQNLQATTAHTVSNVQHAPGVLFLYKQQQIFRMVQCRSHKA